MKTTTSLGSVGLFLLSACSDGSSQEPAPNIADDSSLWPRLARDEGQEVSTANPWEKGFSPASDHPMGGAPGEEGSPQDQAPHDPMETSGGAGAGNMGFDPPTPSPPPLRRIAVYDEGSGTHKVIAVAGDPGPSSHPCSLAIFTNGALQPRTSVAVPAEFPESGRLTWCSQTAWTDECDLPMSGSLYNGNDAIVLMCEDRIVDSLGTVGQDPGEAWESESPFGTLRTEGQRLLRCGNEADPFVEDPTDLALSWVMQAVGESEPDALLRCPNVNLGMGGAGGSSP